MILTYIFIPVFENKSNFWHLDVATETWTPYCLNAQSLSKTYCINENISKTKNERRYENQIIKKYFTNENIVHKRSIILSSKP